MVPQLVSSMACHLRITTQAATLLQRVLGPVATHTEIFAVGSVIATAFSPMIYARAVVPFERILC
jgi:hypothetical protein